MLIDKTSLAGSFHSQLPPAHRVDCKSVHMAHIRCMHAGNKHEGGRRARTVDKGRERPQSSHWHLLPLSIVRISRVYHSSTNSPHAAIDVYLHFLLHQQYASLDYSQRRMRKALHFPLTMDGLRFRKTYEKVYGLLRRQPIYTIELHPVHTVATTL